MNRTTSVDKDFEGIGKGNTDLRALESKRPDGFRGNQFGRSE